MYVMSLGTLYECLSFFVRVLNLYSYYSFYGHISFQVYKEMMILLLKSSLQIVLRCLLTVMF